MVIYAFFMLIAVPLTGFVVMARQRRNDEYRRLIEQHRDLWRKKAITKSRIPGGRYL